METKRDGFVYDADRARLRAKVEAFLQADPATARAAFHNTRDRTAKAAQAVPFDPTAIREVMYRPLDRRFLYLQPRYGDFLRPELQRVWGANNVALYALPRGTGAGPALWCHGLLPDRHAFRGSYGGYAFPLHDRRPAVGSSNVSAELVAGLTTLYGVDVTAEDTFDVILCLLSARTYTLRFAEDLEDVFPHVPFPADHEAFQRAARLGADIRVVETFARAPAGLADPAFVRLVTTPSPQATLDVREPDGATLILGADGSGAVDGLPATLWDFEVSGYPMLRRWLEGREGQTVDLALLDAFRDVCARLAELVDLFGRADTLLAEALAAPLTRDVLWPDTEAAQGAGE